MVIRKFTRARLEKFLAKYATSEKVLDVGSGGSSYDTFFPNRITVDIDPMRNPDIVADACSLPFNDQEFRTVICTEVLEHIENPFYLEKELSRVLQPKGTLILSTRFIFPIHDAPNDYWRFTKYGLMNIFKDWEVVELVEETDTFGSIAVLLQRIGFQTNLRFNHFLKACIYLVATILIKVGHFFVQEEYGDIRKTKKENFIMSSGYYLVCKKK